jgi:phosphate transport system substrate-binding protein
VSVAGVIRVWGTDQVTALLTRWEQAFQKSHPRVHVEAHLTGSDVAMAGLYTGFADVAVLGRESTAVEDKAFEWIFRYPPSHVEIMTGSLDRPSQSPALIAFVHRDNPLSRLTLVQLDAIFGHERRLGAQRNVRTWGELGLTGEWADEFINLYADDVETGTGRFFQHTVLGDSRKMNWEHLTEFKTYDCGRRILQALGADRFGLAVTGWPSESMPQVKTLALARSAGDEFLSATRESLISRRYPLTRAVHAYFNRRPERPVDFVIGGFLRYILSREGQQAISDGADYLPLSAQIADSQLRKLD